MPIRILDAAIVGRIAAGEVVERPSSVVKELMENSIDAGATAITVEIRGGGIDYLRVTDNGSGIEPGQARIAFENHATSKLQSAEQLDDIRTLGFRGEALPSIAAVSHIEMTTRARGQEIGVKLTIDGGADMKVREIGCPEGTTMVMRDLFYNLPVRRAFLKKPSYEGSLVSDVVARMILGNPGVSFRFINNGTSVYHSFGDGNLRHAVFAVYGKQTAEEMVAVDAAEGGTHIHGLIGVGEQAKSTRAHQAFFINGRYVRCAMLSRALEEVCKSRVTIGLYPMCALNLVIPAASVNVNVHPNKLEVRFRDEAMMREAAERLLASAFEGERVLRLGPDRPIVPTVERVSQVRTLDPRPITDEPVPGTADSPRTGAPAAPSADPALARPKPDKGVQLNLFRQAVSEERRKLGDVPAGALRESPVLPPMERRGTPSQNETKPEDDAVPSRVERPLAEENTSLARNGADMAGPDAARRDGSPEKPAPAAPIGDKPLYRVIGVLLKTYILIEADDSLLMIDQHAAHERLQYEKFMAQLEAGMGSQQLLTPLILHLTSREMALIRDNLDVLRDSGYEVDPFGELDIQVRAVPFILGRAELKPAFMDAIGTLDRLRSATVDLRRAEVMQMACKSAIKGGDPLSDSEIEALIRQLLETGAPPTCPHGRPVMKSISRRELEKMFKRIQ